MNEYISKGKAPLVVAQDPDGRALPHRPPQRQPAGVAEHPGAAAALRSQLEMQRESLEQVERRTYAEADGSPKEGT